MLSKKLKMFREKCDLTQKQMAQALNIERSTYTYYETGKSLPNIDTLKRIAQIFNISVDELLEHQPQISLAESPKLSYSRNRQHTSSISLLNEEEQDLILKFRQMNEQQKKALMEKVITEKSSKSDKQ